MAEAKHRDVAMDHVIPQIKPSCDLTPKSVTEIQINKENTDVVIASTTLPSDSTAEFIEPLLVEPPKRNTVGQQKKLT